MKKALALLLAALPITATASAQDAAERYGLEEAMHAAQRNNAELQNAAENVVLAEERVKEARTLFFPELGLQGAATRFNSRRPFALRPEFGSSLLFPSTRDNLFSGEAYMTMPLYEGRRHLNTYRLAQTALKQARAKYEAAKLDIAHETRGVFYRFLLAQEYLRAAKDAAALFGKPPAPSGGKSETAELAALAAELRGEAAEADRAAQAARLDFLKTINRELDTPVTVIGRLETTPIEVDLRKALAWSTELRPELQAQTYRAQMDAIAVNLALGRRNPSVVLGVDYELVGESFPLKQNNWDATVGVRIPFALNFWTQHRQRVSEQRQGQILRAELNDQVQLEVRKAHADIVFWNEEWPRREKEFRSLRRLLDEAAVESTASAAAARATAGVLKAERRWLESVTQHLLSRSRLERAIGRALQDSR